MLLRLPNLAEESCVLVGLCGHLAEGSRRPKRDIVLLARKAKTNKSEGGFVRLLIGKNGHFHCDYALKDYFQDSLPRTTSTFRKVGDTLEEYRGQHISYAAMRAEYLIAREDLPPLLSASIIEYQKDGISLKTKGGRVAVEGLPITEISWKTIGIEKAMVVLHSHVSGPVEEDLLTSTFQIASDAASVILKGAGDGN